MNQVAKAKSAISAVKVRPMSTQVAEVRQNINIIHEALKSIMKQDTHFGVIPGCQKPSLYKPGAEVIIALFKLSTDPIVTDLSQNGEIRYQVKVNITTRDGVFVGSGVGECSSGEEKYMWRSAICEKEFEVTQETMRRIKFKKYQGNITEVQQVRVNPSDLANTILKMAKKRALIDAVLTSTAASDIFSQDIEELPDGFLPENGPTTNEPKKTSQDTIIEKSQEIAPINPPQERSLNGNVISEPQRKRLYAIAMASGMQKEDFKEWLYSNFNYESSKDILKADYEKICEFAAKKLDK